MSRKTNGGIQFAVTILICAILVLICLYFLLSGIIKTPEVPGNDSSIVQPSDSSSPDDDDSSTGDDSSSTGGDSSSSGGDSSSSGGDSSSTGGDSSSTGGDSSSSGGDSSSSGGGSSSSGGGGETPGGDDHLNGKATLDRVGLTGYRLVNGSLVPFTDNSKVDFSNVTSENLFGILPGETVVPGCKFTATMELTNEGNFPLDYWMEVRMTSGFDSALAQQLKVTLTVNGVEYSTTVGQPIGGERTPLGQIAKGKTVTFTLSVEFVESADNNAAQNQTVTFDLYVTTTQAS